MQSAVKQEHVYSQVCRSLFRDGGVGVAVDGTRLAHGHSISIEADAPSIRGCEHTELQHALLFLSFPLFLSSFFMI